MEKNLVYLIAFFCLSATPLANAEECNEFDCDNPNAGAIIEFQNNTNCLNARYFLSTGYGNVRVVSSPQLVFPGQIQYWNIYPRIPHSCPEGTVRIDYVFGENCTCAFFTTVQCVSPEEKTFRIVDVRSVCSNSIVPSIGKDPDYALFKVRRKGQSDCEMPPCEPRIARITLPQSAVSYPIHVTLPDF